MGQIFVGNSHSTRDMSDRSQPGTNATSSAAEGGIKVFGFIVRRADVASEQFHDYWRHPHGTFALTLPTMYRYVQSHQVWTDTLPPSQTRFEGIAEIWFADIASFEGFRSEPNVVKYLLPDEPNFIDMDASFFMPTRQVAVDLPESMNTADALWSPWNRPTCVKLIQLLREGASRSNREHKELMHSMGALFQMRCPAIESRQPPAAEFVEVWEAWWPTLSAFRAGVSRTGVDWRERAPNPSHHMMLAMAESLR